MWRSCSSGALRSTFRPVICAAVVLVTIAWSSPAHPQNDLDGEWVAKQKVEKDEVELTLTLERAGLHIDHCYLAHINRDYFYAGGAYDPDQLFELADLTAQARARIEAVSANLDLLRDALRC